MLDDCMLILDRQPPLGARQIGGERGEYRKLAGKGLGRGDADFRAGIGRQQEVGLARHAAGRHIDDDGDLLSIFARMARSEEHTSELQSLMRISYAVFCLKKKTIKIQYI